MLTGSNHKLDGSWIFNQSDEGDGDISWAEDTDPSDSDTELSHQRPQRPQRPQHTTYASTKQTPVARAASPIPEPNLVMPAIEQRPRPLDGSKTKLSPRTKVYSSQARHRLQEAGALSHTARRGASVNEKALDMVIAVGAYVLDLMASTLRMLKQPISWVLAAYLFLGLMIVVQNLLTSSIYNALSPVCRIPGVSMFRLPLCQSPYASTDRPTISPSSKTADSPEFDALMTVQGKFETVLEDSAAGISLPLHMKRSETSLRDLRQVVRFSTIASRNELLNEFDGFIETARIASYNLQKFNSHVGRAVDTVLSTNRWTQRVLDDMSHKTLESSKSGLLASFIRDKILAPFQPLQFTESRLMDQYITHARLISNEIESLIDEAQALLLVLNNLEDRLDVIHFISQRDNIAAQSSRDEILGQLWTFIGGNRAKLGRVDNQLRLLARVGEYRKLAYAHVAGMILKLQAMGTELEELRTRVGGAESASDRGIKGIPLSVHLESIRLGVERLENQREKSREVERGHVRKILDKAGGDEPRLLVDA